MAEHTETVPWWHPAAFARRRPFLEARMAVTAATRRFFADRGFAETETPILQVCPGMEPHLMALGVTLHEPFGQGARNLYLHTSPEFTMKKLLAAGVPRLYQLAHTFRDGERSPLHHPEFTMLEWYRAGGTYTDLMDDCEALLRAALAAAGGSFYRRGDLVCDPSGPWERLSVAEAFARYAGINVLATVADPADPDPDPALLAAEARRIGLTVGETDRWEDVFMRILLARVEPRLGVDRPTILYDYPVALAALARPKPGDPRLTERFELYVCAVELANAFGELTDADAQARRFAHDGALKERLYGTRYPVDEDFLAALRHGLPASAGIALGFDRLVMLATGAERIEDVLWAPVADFPLPAEPSI
jgi:lysyl-tRNA synthetase class 2